ncbi:hypothetical protein GAPWKB11_1622 [Gilliamella apicola]|jgi:hypothetical protein|nr:hypothetical protein [Gilliamella apicola]KFA58499.1 hypothetical protein GAPWKB11_1622 [Gilliamella apicola]
MVEQHIGYVLCLDKLINTAGDNPLCFKPLYQKLKVDVNIVWKKYHVFSKAAGLFLKQIKEHF